MRRQLHKRSVKKYENEAIVCPPSLINILFTFAAIDNVDHNNPSSSTATSSFHGTSTSIFQQQTDHKIKEPFIIKKSERSDKTAIKLPNYYTDIKPTASNKPEPPKQNVSLEGEEDFILYDDFEWLSKLRFNKNSSSTLPSKSSFSAFHSQQLNSQTISFKTLFSMLPVLLESINSPAMVRQK